METTVLGPPASLYPATRRRVPLQECGRLGPPGQHAHRPAREAHSGGHGSVWTAHVVKLQMTAWEKEKN